MLRVAGPLCSVAGKRACWAPTRWVTAGKATPQATHAFVQRSALPVYLQLDKSQLFAAPVVHGSLRNWADAAELDEEYIQSLAHQAVWNKSNALVVYEHRAGKEYHIPDLKGIFSDSEFDIKREEMITIANLGVVEKGMDVEQRLLRARQVADLETIDVAYVEINDAVLREQREAVIAVLNALEQACSEGRLQSFGAKSSLAPYTYHKPLVKRSGKNVLYNISLETSCGGFRHMEMILYPISPSIGIPSTHPLLDNTAHEEMVTVSEEVENGEENEGEGEEIDSSDTMQAVDEGTADDQEEEQEEDLEPELCLETDDDDGSTAKPVDSDKCDDVELDEETLSQIEQAVASDERNFVRVACDPLLCFHNADAVVSEARDGSELSAQIKAVEAKQRAATPWMLIDAVNTPVARTALAAALDTLCPPLESTPLLEDKATRVVLSVGCDLLLMDAECSALVGKFHLTADQLLDAEETDDVFEHFAIPR